MKRLRGLWIFAAAAVALTPAAAIAGGHGKGRGADAPGGRAQIERGQNDFDRDRMRDRDRIEEPAHDRDRIQDQDRTNAPNHAKLNDDAIYGQSLMSVEERNQYREQLRLIGPDPEKRTQFMAEHHENMQQRAKAQGVDLENGKDVPRIE